MSLIQKTFGVVLKGEPRFNKLHTTENTIDILNNLLYLQNIFKRRVVNHAVCTCLPLLWLFVARSVTNNV